MDPVRAPVLLQLILALVTALQGDDVRARLVTAHREAVALVTRAARPDTAADARRDAVRDAVERLRALGADPPASTLPAELRRSLRTAADALASTPSNVRLDGAQTLALLERVRVALEGEVALGLTFEGGFS